MCQDEAVNSEAYRRGIALFNRAHFYEAHEVLEDVWRAAHGAEKRFLQALIQLAVGLHHYSTGNLAGARSLLARGGRKLAEYPAAYGGIHVGKLRAAVRKWEAALEQGQPAPPLPRVERARR